MVFKKHGKQLFGVAFTEKEEAIIDAEIEHRAKEQEVKYLEEFESNIDAQLLGYLHCKMHWGKEGLTKVFYEFGEFMNELTDYYQMKESDTSFTAKQKLKDMGVDVDELRKGKPHDKLSEHSD